MKRMIMILISLMLIAFTCLPAMAAETAVTEASPDSAAGGLDYDRIIFTDRDFYELPNDSLPLGDEERLQIAQDYKAQYETSGDPADYNVYCYLTLSNDMKLVFVTKSDWVYLEYWGYEQIGEYVYSHGQKEALLYQDGKFTTIRNAYQSGLINDLLLGEIDSVMHFDRLAPEPVTAAPEPSVDAVAKPATTDSPTEAPTTEPVVKPATKDQATPDSPKASRIPDNGVVATGESGALWFAVLPVLVAAAAGVYVYRKHNNN